MTTKKVQVWIFEDAPAPESQCLIFQTSATRGSYWQPVTGSVEPNESHIRAALREVQEEAGFYPNHAPLDTGYTFEYNSRWGGTAREKVFAVVGPAGFQPTIDPGEHQAWQWVNPHKALEQLQFETNKEGLKRAYLALFQKNLLLPLWLALFSLGALAWPHTTQAAQEAQVVMDGAAILSQADRQAQVLETKSKGEKIRISSESRGGWFRARTSTGAVGWIHQSQVSPGQYDTTLNFSNVARHQGERHVRVQKTHPDFSFRLGIGPAFVWPPTVNRAVGASSTKSYTGFGLVGQAGYFVSDVMRVITRLDFYSANGKAGSYKLHYSGLGLMVGLEHDFYTNPLWRYYWNAMGGVGLMNFVTIENPDTIVGNYAGTFSNYPVVAGAGLGFDFSLLKWLSFFAEVGVQMSQALSKSDTATGFGNGEPVSFYLSVHKFSLFLGAQVTF